MASIHLQEFMLNYRNFGQVLERLYERYPDAVIFHAENGKVAILKGPTVGTPCIGFIDVLSGEVNML